MVGGTSSGRAGWRGIMPRSNLLGRNCSKHFVPHAAESLVAPLPCECRVHCSDRAAHEARYVRSRGSPGAGQSRLIDRRTRLAAGNGTRNRILARLLLLPMPATTGAGQRLYKAIQAHHGVPVDRVPGQPRLIHVRICIPRRGLALALSLALGSSPSCVSAPECVPRPIVKVSRIGSKFHRT